MSPIPRCEHGRQIFLCPRDDCPDQRAALRQRAEDIATYFAERDIRANPIRVDVTSLDGSVVVTQTARPTAPARHLHPV